MTSQRLPGNESDMRSVVRCASSLSTRRHASFRSGLATGCHTPGWQKSIAATSVGLGFFLEKKLEQIPQMRHERFDACVFADQAFSFPTADERRP